MMENVVMFASTMLIALLEFVLVTVKKDVAEEKVVPLNVTAMTTANPFPRLALFVDWEDVVMLENVETIVSPQQTAMEPLATENVLITNALLNVDFAY